MRHSPSRPIAALLLLGVAPLLPASAQKFLPPATGSHSTAGEIGAPQRPAERPRALVLGATEAKLINILAQPTVMATLPIAAGGHDLSMEAGTRVAVIRAGDEVHFIDRQLGTVLGAPQTIAGAGGADDSDWVMSTKTRAVALGGTQALIFDTTVWPPQVLGAHTILDGGHDLGLSTSRDVAVVRAGSAVQYFRLSTGEQLGQGHVLSGGCGASDRNWVAVAGRHALVTGGDQALVIDLKPTPPQLIGVHSIESGGHDVAIWEWGHVGVVRSGNRLQYFDLQSGAEKGTGHTLAGGSTGPGDHLIITGVPAKVVAIGGTEVYRMDLFQDPPQLLSTHWIDVGPHALTVDGVRSPGKLNYWIGGVDHATALGTVAVSGNGAAGNSTCVAMAMGFVVLGDGRARFFGWWGGAPTLLGDHAIPDASVDLDFSLTRDVAIVSAGGEIHYFRPSTGAEFHPADTIAGGASATDSDWVHTVNF